jgi:hypothetical protein
MNIIELTPQQLKRAASIKEQIEGLNKELRRVLNGSSADGAVSSTKKRTMSAAVKKKIAAAQKARWAKLRESKSGRLSTKPVAKNKAVNSAANAKRSAKLKAYWAAKKTAKK